MVTGEGSLKIKPKELRILTNDSRGNDVEDIVVGFLWDLGLLQELPEISLPGILWKFPDLVNDPVFSPVIGGNHKQTGGLGIS